MIPEKIKTFGVDPSEEYKSELQISENYEAQKESDLLMAKFESQDKEIQKQSLDVFFYIYGAPEKQEAGIFRQVELELKNFYLQRMEVGKIIKEFAIQSQHLNFLNEKRLLLQQEQIKKMKILMDEILKNIPFERKEPTIEKKQETEVKIIAETQRYPFVTPTETKPVSQIKLGAIHRQVLEKLKNQAKPVTFKFLGNAFNKHVMTISKHCRVLANMGLVDYDPQWGISINEKGRRILSENI